MAKKRNDFDDNDFFEDDNLEEVQPLDEDDLEIVEPVDEDDLEVVEAVGEGEDDLEMVEPVGDDDLEVVEPVGEDEDDLEIVEPVGEDDLEVVEPVAQDKAQPVEPIEDFEEVAADEAETQHDLQTVQPVDESEAAAPPPLPTEAEDETELLDLPPKDQPEPVEPVAESDESAKGEETSVPQSKPTMLSKKSPQPTMLSKKSPAPTKLSKKSAQQTKISKKTADPTKLAKGELDELEPANEEDATKQYAAPGSKDASEDAPTADAVDISEVDLSESEQETQDLDQLVDEDMPVQETAEAEEEPDLSEMFDSDEEQAAEDDIDLARVGEEASEVSDETVSFDPTAEDEIEDVDESDFIDEDEASAVDLGAAPDSGSQLSGVDPIADDIESGTELGGNADEVAEVSEDDALDILSEDDESAPVNLDATPVPGKGEAVEAGEDEDLMEVTPVDDLDDEPAPATSKKGKKKKAAVADEFDEDEQAPRDRKGRPVKPPKPKRFRWMIVGMFLMTLLVAGGAAGVWYLKPELIDDAIKAIPESPNMTAKAKELKELQSGPELEAVALINKGQYADAIANLQNETTPTAKNLRGHARLLQYLRDKKAAGQPPVATDPEVQTALQELRDGNQQLLAEQIGYAFDSVKYKTQADQLVSGDAAAKEIAKLLSTPLEQAPAQVSVLMKRKETLEQNNKALVDALNKTVDAKIPDGDLDPKKLESIVGALAKAEAELKTINTILDKSAKIQDDGTKGVQTLIDQKAKLDKLIADVNTTLKSADLKESGPEGVKKLVTLRAELEKEKERLAAAIATAGKELFELSPKTKDPLKNLVEGAKAAKQRADSPITLPLAHVFSTLGDVGEGAAGFLRKSLDAGGMAVELGYFRAVDQLSEKPADRLDRWIAILEDYDRRDAKDLDRAAKDAEWVRSPKSKSTAEAQTKALYVAALVARNQRDKGSFDKARQMLSQVKKEAEAEKLQGNWLNGATAALKQLEDPKAYFLPEAMKKAQIGDAAGAMNALELGLQAQPNHPELLLTRASLLFDAHEEGGMTAEVANKIRQDATVAQKDPATDVQATLLLAGLEEKLRNWTKAEEYYRQALKLPNQTDAEKNAVRLAWGNFLLRDRTEEETSLPGSGPAPKARPMPMPPKVEPFPPAPKPAPKTSRVGTPQVFSLATLVIGQIPGVPSPKEDPAEKAKTEDAMKLAKEIIASAKDKKTKGQGHMLLGRALFKQGRRNEGLKEFAKGMSLAFPGIGGDSLEAMLLDHPSFRRPDAANRSNPTIADKYFGQGLHLFWSKQYVAAETQFDKAIQHYRKDARYYYYLGLSQLYQNSVAKRKDAETNFEEGSALESESLPPSSEINISLERVQGPIRQYLDRIRHGLPAKVGS